MNFRKKRTLILFTLVVGLSCKDLFAQKPFIHPGITYTQGDLDRMKAMVDAKVESYYSTFLKLRDCKYTSMKPAGKVAAIAETRFNVTIGRDGRIAHDNALLWHLTGDKHYADKAVTILNNYNDLTNCSHRGTAPLDNGKIYMLLEAAELMRNYEGWQPKDQQKFKDMLVYPGYSTITVPEDHFSLTDTENDVTFYWNIYNFDPLRFGNQGLFAARGMMAMGIFLDNEIMYDRAYRYLLDLGRREDDQIPYASGPVVSSSRRSGRTMDTYSVRQLDTIPDYGYDEQLKHYIYPKGQLQEAARDQGHVMAGINSYVSIAEIAWTQGDTIYGALDNRLLKGIEYNTQYNLSARVKYDDQPGPFEPTVEDGTFLQVMSRSGRWFSKAISSRGRGAGLGSSGTKEEAMAHYAIRMNTVPKDMKWLQRSYNYVMDRYGYENWGDDDNHYYEWLGWGTLTKRREKWMAGDPVSFASGRRVSGIHHLPGMIAAVDYDYFSDDVDPEGHTYHNTESAHSLVYRTDGSVEIRKAYDGYVVSRMNDGEWMNYTVAIPKSGCYSVYVTSKSTREGISGLYVSLANGEKTGMRLPATNNTFKEMKIGSLIINAGASVLRVSVEGQDNILELSRIRVELDSETADSNKSPFEVGEGIKNGFADIGPAQLYYEEKGQGETIILLHAHSVDRRMWDGQFEPLAEKYHVIRYDARGYGLSSNPIEGVDFNYAEDLYRFMNVMGIEKAHLVGLSMGTLTITDFLTKHPEMALSVVLVAGGLSPEQNPSDPQEDLEAFRNHWKKMMCSWSFGDSEKLNLLLDEWKMWQISHKESKMIYIGDKTTRPYYLEHKIEVPALVIIGESDVHGSIAAGEEMTRIMPHTKTVRFRNAGHFSSIEQPEAFTNAVLDFIGSLKKKDNGLYVMPE